MLSDAEKHRRKMLESAKRRAKEQGLAFDLRLADVIVPERCPVCGTPLKFNKVRRGHDSPSVDRIVPAKGYLRENVAVICMRCNSIKTNATPDELLRVALYAFRHTTKPCAPGFVYQRGLTWWCSFSRKGFQYRVSSHSQDEATARALLARLTGHENTT